MSRKNSRKERLPSGLPPKLTPAGFEALYESHKNAVYSFACYLAGNKKEAEDLFQETWLRIIQHRRHLSNRPDLKTWILTISMNRKNNDGCVS